MDDLIPPLQKIEIKILFDNTAVSTTQIDYITMMKINDILYEYKKALNL